MSLHMDGVTIGAALYLSVGLITLWLRLRWRTRQERARRRTFVSLARTLPRDGQLEERAADGTVLRIVVGLGPRQPHSNIPSRLGRERK